MTGKKDWASAAALPDHWWRRLSWQAALVGVVAMLAGVGSVLASIRWGPTGSGLRGFAVVWCLTWVALALVAPLFANKRRPALAFLGGRLSVTLGLAMVVSLAVSWWLLLGYFGAWLAVSGSQIAYVALRQRRFLDTAWAERESARRLALRNDA